MAKPKKKKKVTQNEISMKIPKERGCLDGCGRWDAFVSKIWEEEREICPEENCPKCKR